MCYHRIFKEQILKSFLRIDQGTTDLSLNTKPKLTFGIVFDKQWTMPECETRLVLDRYILLHVEAGLSTGSDNPCPFLYGIAAGADLYRELQATKLYNWGEPTGSTLQAFRCRRF